jgi:heme o synthase
MGAQAQAGTGALGISAPRAVCNYFMLTKPRVLSMVLMTTLIGFYLGTTGQFDWLTALKLMVGTALAGGGMLALNQYLERDLDARMERTCRRPIPAGQVSPDRALLFGNAIMLIGVGFLAVAVNLVTASVIALIAALYLLAYTPLKRSTWLCNMVGAVPGALPPVVGWVATRGSFAAEPFVVFAIMYLWQLPHSLAIGRLYQGDYARAGIHLFPSTGRWRHIAEILILFDSVLLLAASLLPTLMGFAGFAYLVTAVLFGSVMIVPALRLIAAPERSDVARHLMRMSLIYLPCVLLVLVLDKI